MRRRNASAHSLRATLATLVLAAMMLALPATSAGGTSDQAAPLLDETALTLKLPGPAPDRAEPVVLDGATYALFVDGDNGAGSPAYGLQRVDLATGDSVGIARWPSEVFQLATDGTNLYIVHRDRFGFAFSQISLVDGRVMWSASTVLVQAMDVPYSCPPPTFNQGMAFWACGPWEAAFDDLEIVAGQAQADYFVMAVDLAAGERAWTWHKGADDEWGAPIPPSAVVMTPSAARASLFYGLSASPHNVYVVSLDDAGRGGYMHAYVWALDRVTGQLRWVRDSLELEPDSVQEWGSNAQRRDLFLNFATPLAVEGTVFLKFQNMYAIDELSGLKKWSYDVRRFDESPDKRYDHGSGFAYDGTFLYVAARHTITAFDLDRQDRVWTSDKLPAGQEFHSGPMYVGDGILYARAVEFSEHTDGLRFAQDKHLLLAIDVSGASGSALRWKHDFVPASTYVEDTKTIASHRIAFGEGVAAVQGAAGTLVLLGHAGASIDIQPLASTLFPAPGQEITLDLSGSKPGAQHPVTSFRIDWGDGTIDEWGPGTEFKHRFALSTDYTVRIDAQNAAGQTSTSFVIIGVGRVPPGAEDPLAVAFNEKNQELTFFLMGLFITAGGAGFGISRVHKRRALLGIELSHIEDAYIMTRHIPIECEETLSERKAHVRGLLLDGKILEGQYAILDRRLDELRAELRVNSLEENFDFMPVGMMRSLQRILADGVVSKGEHDSFLKDLAASRAMTPKQKTRVRQLVSRWFARDSAEALVPA